MSYEEELESIVGEDNIHGWIVLNPTVYYKNGKPYGLISEFECNDETIILSCAKENGYFSLSMLKRIFEIYNSRDIVIVTDDVDSQDKIKEVLTKYGFTFYYGNYGEMYSKHVKEN